MPNIIITAAKEAHPKYRNIPDDELTLRYAKEFPEYLEVDDFKADYDRITRKPVPVVATPKERAGAIESIGRRASGGLQGGLGGPLWKGVELGARLLGADDLAQYSKEVSAEAREYDRQQRLKSANTGVAGFLGDVAGAAPSLLPILPAIAAAPLVGLAQRTAAGIAFGATGGLSTFSDAEKAYYDKYKSEGMSDSEAESAARKSAAIPSIASGIATGTITRFMPVGGVESVTGLFGKGAAASAAGKAAGAEAGKRAVAAGLTEAGVAASIKSGVARQVGLAEARALVATSIPKAFIKGATNEAIEEGIDQIAQSAIQKLSYDPELTLKQAIDNVINSAMVGGALGGSIQAAVQPSARKGAEAAIRQDKIYNELRVQAEAEAKSDATRREDRLEDEMRREKELKALDRTAAENLEAAHAAQQKQRDAQALADKTLIDTLNEKERVEAEAKLTASQQSAVTAIRDLAGKTVGAKITDVTPEGYGPKEPPAATGATAQKMGGLTHAETVLDSELGTRKIEVKDGDTVVGYIAFGNDLNGYDTINMVWVKPDYRGKGISTELYRKALASAKERGRKGLASVDANLHTPEKTKSTRKNFIVRESTDRADTKRALELSGKAHDSVHFIEGEQASRATPAATGATGQHPKLAGLNWARENIPWGERGTTTPELRHKIATALRDAGFRNRVEAEEMSLGEKPFPTREKFEQSVDGNLTLDAMQLLSKVESELRDVGLNPREATLPKREDFKTAEEFWKAAYDIEGKMRATGASAFAGLVRTGQVAGFTKPATPAATGAAQKPEIYETRIRGEDGSVSIRFAVQKEGRKPGERGGGDLLFRTQSEAEKYVAEHVQGVLKRNKIKAEADAAARAELLRPRTSIELFTQGMSPMASKRARNALDNSVSADGMPYRRSELVEKDVQDGAVVITGKDGRRRLQRPSGAYRTDSQLSKTAMDYAEFLVREKRKAEISGTDPLPIPAPAETGAKTEPAYISPEELMARQPKAIPSETVARIEAEEKAYQAQADIKAVTDRILIMIGRKVLPKNVKVVYQPESNFAAYYQSGEIIINAARIVNVEAVLVEEALHAVWADPELQAAWDTVKKTVTIQDIDEQRLRAAADKRYPDNAELREEAAVAKLVRHRTPAIKGFLMAIRKAIAKAFGFHVKLSDIELIQNAAMSKLTTDSKAVQISPPAAPAAKVGTKTRQVEITISDISGFGNKDKTKKVSGSLVKLDADPANEYVAFKFSNSFWKVVEKSTGLSPGETYGKTKAEAISKANANILRAGGSKKMSEIIGSSKKLNESPPAETGAAGQKPSEPTPANPTASKFKPIGVGRKVVSVTSRPDTSTWQVTSFADEYREQPSGHEGYKTLGEALKDVEYVGPENKQTVALGWHSMDAYFEASKQNPGATKANPDNFIYASPRRPLSGLRVPDAVQSLSYKTKTGGMAGVVEVSRTLTLDEMVSFELAPINLAASDAYWKSVADAVHPGHENIRAGKESSSPIPAAEAKPTPAATEAAGQKMPWEMTLKDFQNNQNVVKVGNRQAYYSGIGGAEATRINAIIDAAHRKSVVGAANSGKPVSLEVAAAYPEILAKLEATRPKQEVLDYYTKAASKARLKADEIQARWDNPGEGITPMFQRVKFLKRKAAELESKVESLKSDLTPSKQMTPMQRQYRALKEKYPNEVVLIRLGDFYEAFWEDAEKLSKDARVTLTKRQDVPMAGVPYHSVDSYVAKMEAAGHKVKLVEDYRTEAAPTLKPTPAATGATAVEPSKSLRREFKADKNGSTLLLTKSSKPQYAGMVKVTEIYPDGTPGGDRIFKTEEDAIRSIQGESVPDGHRHPESWPVGGKAWKEVTKQKPPAATEAAQKVAVEPAIGVGKVLEIPASSTKAERKAFENIQRDIALIKDYGPKEMQRESRARRKSIERADISMRRAAEVLGLELPRRSTFYNPESDLANANKLEAELRDLFGKTQPTPAATGAAAKTGKPWVDTLHRGVREKASRTDSGDYGSNATYWSGDESRATAYSKPVIGTTGKAGSVIKSEVSLGNPLVFKTTEDARAFRKSIVGPDLLDKPQSQVAADLIEKAIREKGHDGVVVYDSNSNYTAHPDRPFEVVVYDKPTPPDAPRYAAAERDASDQPAFYSRLNRAVEQTTQNKASGAQWKATIKNSKLGTNADEYALVGVGDLEDGKTYTKQEVLDYLRANEVVVKDVTLGGKKEPIAGDTEKASRRHELLSLFESQGDLTDEQSQELDDLNTWLEKRRSTISERTKFETHQLPGAVEGSYRERLLMVPSKPQPAEIQYVAGLARPWRIYAKGEKVHASSYETESEARASLERYPEFSGVNWRDGHELYSSFANPIVRGRTNERLIPIESLRESNPDVYARVKADGRTHALMVFVEENQLPLGTRWHEVNGVKFEGGGSFERASAYAKEHGGTVEKKYSGELAKMPELFRDNGYAIGLKYGLRYAVERNADLYGWTTGEQQAARYNLSKQVKSVTWNEGNKEFSAVPISDGDTISRSGVEAVDLSGIVGKDVAQKLIEATANRFGNRRLEGLDLKIGGEGLKKLYDVEFRNIINNLPAVKKSGQKVGTTAIRSEYKRTFDGREITAEAFKNRVNEVATAWEERRSPEAWERWNVALDRQAESVAKAMDEGQPYSVAMQEHGSNGLLLALGLDGRLGDDLIASNIHSLAITPAIRDAVMGGQARFAASERGAGSELGALQGGVDGVDYLNWADRFRTNFITKYAPITKMERVLRESAGMGRAEFGMERWFERLAGVAGIAKASIIEMRMELDPLVAGDEKAFNNYIFWQYIERRSTLRAQALADVASARAMVANGTATDADRASIARNNKLADQMEFARYDNPTVAKKNLDSIRANLAKSGALEDMDKAVAIYVKHTNLALDNIVDSGYLAQDRIDKYRNQFPVYIPIINLQIPDSKNGYQVTMGRVGISDPNFKSKNPLAAFDEYIFRMHAKAEVNKAKRRIHKLVVEAARPDIARVEYDRLHSTESGFSLRVNGVDTMVVAHPEVVAAVNSFSDTASNTLNDFLRKANSVLKFGATSASLAFQVRNLLMGDLPALALMSKAGITNPINAVTFVIDVITSFAHNFRASAYGEYSPLMLEFMKSGAMGSSMHSSIDSLGRDTQTGASSEGKISQYIIDAFGKMSNTIEQTSKLAGFKRLMDKAGVATLAELNDPIKQMALVAEVRNYCGSPDFARNGSVMGLAMIRLGFVFVNPAMAGNASALERLTANLNKNSSDSDKKAALTAQIRLGFTVGLATMISYALRSQDDEAEESYDGLDKKSKEDNFHLVTDKYDVDIEGNKVRRFVKIPKRGVIKIVANTMEAYLDYSRAKDPEDFTRMMGRVLEEVIPLDIKGDTLEERIQGTMASVNPAIRVPIEYATGMSFYARQPTVPRSMRGAANSEQYRERTNENIKTLAGVFGVSPLKFKQALDNATGGLTRTLLPEKESELSVDSPINIPLVKGYFSPTYRESEDKEYISELRKEADTATVVRTRAAVAFMKSMEGKTIKETYQAAAAKYARTQPELFDRIDDLIDQKMSGATIEDRHITSLPNAQRAKIVMARLQKLPVGERREAVKVLYRKKVISDATAYEMLKAGYNFRQ